MNENIIKKLINFGLLETEAKVYCAAISLEESTVDKLAKQANVNRSSCYAILNRLKELGLVSSKKKKGKTFFSSVQPEKFLDILDDKKEIIHEIIPDIKSLFEISRGQPDVKFFEGKEGLKTVLNTILKEAKEVLIFGEGECFINAIPGWMEAYVTKRVKKNIKVKMILKASPYGLKSMKQLRNSSDAIKKLVKVRMLPEAYNIKYSGFDIYNNKIILYSFEKQNNAVVIESQLISEMMRTVFNLLWDITEKYNHLMQE